MKCRTALLFLALAMDVAAQVPGSFGTVVPPPASGFEEPDVWEEARDVEPPGYPQEGNLREIYVSAVATNKYFIDASTLSVGSDRVIRYVLVVHAAGGATNVSFEGIRCADLSWKHYATGHREGGWTKSRAGGAGWRPIENKPVNRHHAALSRDFFCPKGIGIRTADEGRNALRLGKHPGAD